MYLSSADSCGRPHTCLLASLVVETWVSFLSVSPNHRELAVLREPQWLRASNPAGGPGWTAASPSFC